MIILLIGLGDGGNGSEFPAYHPGVDILSCLHVRDPGADLDHGAELASGVDRRAVEVGQEASLLLSVRHVTPLARDGVGALAP